MKRVEPYISILCRGAVARVSTPQGEVDFCPKDVLELLAGYL